MIAADGDECVLKFADLGESREQQPERGVDRLGLAEVVSEVLAHFRHVRQESRHFSLQLVGLDTPQLFTGALDPLAVGIGGPKPVAEGLAWFTVGEEGVEIAPHLRVDFLLRCLQRA
jgi:hypothetical protein